MGKVKVIIMRECCHVEMSGVDKEEGIDKCWPNNNVPSTEC